MTVELDGQRYELGPRFVHPVGATWVDIERTSVGGDGTFDEPTGMFNGAIDRLRLRDLSTDKWLERWNMNEGQGSTITGVNGAVLQIGNATWAQRSN